MADLIYTGPTDSADGAAGSAPGAGPAFGGADPSQVTGQDPAANFGIPLNYSTGLGGSPPPGGQAQGGGDPTNEPNQYPSAGTFTHVPLDGTGLDGSQGAPAATIETTGTTFLVTDPNYTAGKPGGGSGVQLVEAPVAVGGTADSTMVVGQYPPARPIVPGDYYPTEDGIGEGSVLVGGFKKGQRG
jgi:hypothetical protein